MRRPERWWTVASTVFALAGIALVTGAALLHQAKHEVIAAISLNLGVAAIAIVMLDALWRLTGGSPLETQLERLEGKLGELAKSVALVERARTVGLENVF